MLQKTTGYVDGNGKITANDATMTPRKSIFVIDKIMKAELEVKIIKEHDGYFKKTEHSSQICS